MNFLFIIIYAIVLIFFLIFVYRRLKDINNRNIENIWCTFLRKRNNVIFAIIVLLLLALFVLWSLVILTLI